MHIRNIRVLAYSDRVPISLLGVLARVTQACNLLSNVMNQNRGAFLSEPFPWTVIQGVAHIFIFYVSQIESIKMNLPTHTTQFEPYRM